MNGFGTMSRMIMSAVGSLWAKMISRPRRSVRYVDCRNFQKSSEGSSVTRTWLTSSTNFGGYLARVYKLTFLLVSYRHRCRLPSFTWGFGFPPSGSIDRGRMPLWSTLVVSLLWPSRTTGCLRVHFTVGGDYRWQFSYPSLVRLSGIPCVDPRSRR